MTFTSRLSQMAEQQGREAVFGLVLAEVTASTDEGYELRLRSTRVSTIIGPARLATMMAGNQRGSYFAPEVGDEVVVGFELGDINRPIILGALWSDRDRPPVVADTGSSNNVRTLVSRAGHQVTFDDGPNSQRITIRSHGGMEIVLQDQPTPHISIKTNDAGVMGSKLVLDGVAWNHQHATGTGPSGPPISMVPVL